LAEYGLPSEFPIEVETFAQKIDTIAEEIASSMICGYVNLPLIQKMLKILMMLCLSKN
jgi:hypothetical protein